MIPPCAHIYVISIVLLVLNLCACGVRILSLCVVPGKHKHVLRACAKTWTGLWTTDCGLWTVDWTVDCGLCPSFIMSESEG